MRRARLISAILAVAFAVTGLSSCYFWLFHGWAASGPPTSYPELHRAWSVRFFWLMVLCAPATGMALWRYRRAGAASRPL